MLRHSWDLSPAEAVALQRKLAAQVREEPLPGRVRTIAGVDCAFLDDGKRIAAVAVLCDAHSLEVLETAQDTRPCTFSYISGLLSFREAPAVLASLEGLSVRPDLLMCDGQGIAHPRGLGIASHVGLWLDVPTVGIAKSRLCGDYRMPGEKKGCHTRLMLRGRAIGAVVRTRTGVKPLFVSIGHRITLDEAVRWALRTSKGVRLCQPTRLADQAVARLKRRLSTA